MGTVNTGKRSTWESTTCTKRKKGMIHALILRLHLLYQFPAFKLRLYMINGPPNPCASVAFWSLVGLISSPFCENNMSWTSQSCCSECLAGMVCNQTCWDNGEHLEWQNNEQTSVIQTVFQVGNHGNVFLPIRGRCVSHIGQLLYNRI